MNIRKALERAKRERQSLVIKKSKAGKDLDTETGLQSETSTNYNDDNEKIYSNDDKIKIEKWTPPKYSESKFIELNYKILKKNRCIGAFPDNRDTEAYKILRTQILHKTKEKKHSTIMITSALPGEGKTLTAVNISLVLSKELNQTVLLVDCDLKQQKVYKYMGILSKAGLIDYFIKNQKLKDLFIWPGIDKFTLISGGNTVSDSSEYLGSPKMVSLLKELKTRYDDRYIIFDTPPVLVGADAMTLAPMVDGVLMVVQAGKTSIRDVKKAVGLIPKEKFLGFVLNRHNTKLTKYMYEYSKEKKK